MNPPTRRWVFERGILYALDVNRPSPFVSPKVKAAFEEIGASSVNELSASIETPNSTILTRFATQRRCFGARIENRIAAYGWVSQTNEYIGEHERELQLRPREAYIWDCATLKEFRGKRLYSALLSHIVGVLRSEGITRVWIGSSLMNQPSLKGFDNAGFQPVVTLISIRLGEMRCCFAIGHPAAPDSLIEAARRALVTKRERLWGPLVIGTKLPKPCPPCAEIESV